MTITRLIDRLRTGLLFLPTVIVAAAVLAAVVLPAVDARFALPSITRDVDTARTLLSTEATATVTFAGLVFSITIVALQLTSSQFSPRVLRQFLRDLPSQLALGAFVGTFVYDLIVLARVRGGDDEFVPGLAVDVSVLLAVLTVFSFVGFVSHTTQSIRVVRIIEVVAGEARDTAAALHRVSAPEPDVDDVLAPLRALGVLVRRDVGAVLTDLDRNALAAVARRHDVTIAMVPAIGDYVPEGAPVLEIWGVPDVGARPDWDAVDDHIGFGTERTMIDDIAFGYRQLVDIAEKALSPALNDPTTGVQCLDRLHDLLRTEVQRPAIARMVVDDDGTVRLIHPIPTWSELVGLAFDEIRQYGSSSLQIVRRMRAALDDLAAVSHGERRAVVDEQLASLDRTVRRNFPDPVDRHHAGIPDGQGIGDNDD